VSPNQSALLIAPVKICDLDRAHGRGPGEPGNLTAQPIALCPAAQPMVAFRFLAGKGGKTENISKSRHSVSKVVISGG